MSTITLQLGGLEIRHTSGADNGEVRSGGATQFTTGFGSGSKRVYKAGASTAPETLTGKTSTEPASPDMNKPGGVEPPLVPTVSCHMQRVGSPSQRLPPLGRA